MATSNQGVIDATADFYSWFTSENLLEVTADEFDQWLHDKKIHAKICERGEVGWSDQVGARNRWREKINSFARSKRWIEMGFEPFELVAEIPERYRINKIFDVFRREMIELPTRIDRLAASKRVKLNRVRKASLADSGDPKETALIDSAIAELDDMEDDLKISIRRALRTLTIIDERYLNENGVALIDV